MEQQLFNEMLFPLVDSGSAGDEAELKTFNGLSVFTEQAVEELNDINSGAGFERYAHTEPELVLSIRYGTILKERVIAVPNLGVLNLHSGKLPGYRGVMASFWALLNDESSLGTTLHYIDDPGIDSGPVIATTELAVVPGKSYLWHVLELYKEGCQSMVNAVAAIAEGKTLESVRQAGEGNYFTFPMAKELDRFEEKGLRLFSPEDIEAIYVRFLNA